MSKAETPPQPDTCRIQVAYAAGSTLTVRTGGHEPVELTVDGEQTVTVPAVDATRIAGALGGQVLPHATKEL